MKHRRPEAIAPSTSPIRVKNNTNTYFFSLSYRFFWEVLLPASLCLFVSGVPRCLGFLGQFPAVLVLSLIWAKIPCCQHPFFFFSFFFAFLSLFCPSQSDGSRLHLRDRPPTSAPVWGEISPFYYFAHHRGPSRIPRVGMDWGGGIGGQFWNRSGAPARPAPPACPNLQKHRNSPQNAPPPLTNRGRFW